MRARAASWPNGARRALRGEWGGGQVAVTVADLCVAAGLCRAGWAAVCRCDDHPPIRADADSWGAADALTKADGSDVGVRLGPGA